MNEHDDKQLDCMLRKACAPPPPDVLAAMAAAATRAAPPVRRLWRWPLLLCAAATVLLLLRTGDRRGPEGHDARALGTLWAAAYEDAAQRDFGGGCCDPDLDLAAACRERFEVPLALAASTDLAVIGRYCGLPTGGCMALLVRAGSDPICVYLVPRAQDPGVTLPAGSTLHLSRREITGLVLYALSRRPHDALLQGFEIPSG